MPSAQAPLGRQVRRLVALDWARELRELPERPPTHRTAARGKVLRFMLGRYPHAAWEPHPEDRLRTAGPSPVPSSSPARPGNGPAARLEQIARLAEGSQERNIARDALDEAAGRLVDRLLVAAILILPALAVVLLAGGLAGLVASH